MLIVLTGLATSLVAFIVAVSFGCFLRDTEWMAAAKVGLPLVRKGRVFYVTEVTAPPSDESENRRLQTFLRISGWPHREAT